MRSRHRGLGLLAVSVAATTLSGCSLIQGLNGDTGYLSFSGQGGQPTLGEPIAYVDGTATVELTGGTVASLTLPLQSGSSRDPSFGDQVGYRADPWAVELSGFDFPDPAFPQPASWDMTLHDLSHGHWVSQDYTGGCHPDVHRDELHVEGTIKCVGLQWSDAVAPVSMGAFPSALPGHGPFDATVTFQATLAKPAPSPGPAASDTPEAHERTVRASHILYAPNDDPMAGQTLAPIDPAWGTARAEAQAAADALRAIPDATARETAFAARAKAESDDTGSGPDGGSLGSFTRDTMVSAFSDALFDPTDLQPGDIIGPVRTDFGWHVIMYVGEGESAPGD